ncbi:MAG: sugar ABC transporter ATP-binding protein, partial [Actinomycetota bacterium]
HTEHSIPVKVNLIEELGSDAFLYAELQGSKELHDKLGSGDDSSQIVLRADPRKVPNKGDIVHVQIRAGEQHNFSASTGERLPE